MAATRPPNAVSPTPTTRVRPPDGSTAARRLRPRRHDDADGGQVGRGRREHEREDVCEQHPADYRPPPWTIIRAMARTDALRCPRRPPPLRARGAPRRRLPRLDVARPGAAGLAARRRPRPWPGVPMPCGLDVFGPIAPVPLRRLGRVPPRPIPGPPPAVADPHQAHRVVPVHRRGARRPPPAPVRAGRAAVLGPGGVAHRDRGHPGQGGRAAGHRPLRADQRAAARARRRWTP